MGGRPPLWWDTALKCSSALRAAAFRAFGAEVCSLTGAASASAFVDIAKFYDSLDPIVLMRKLIDMDFPASSLVLHLQAHFGWRVIIHEGVAGNLIGGSRSILAGCTSSNSIARSYLHHICDDLGTPLPRLKLNTFVDDLVMWMLSSRTAIVKEMAAAICQAFGLIGAAGLD